MGLQLVQLVCGQRSLFVYLCAFGGAGFVFRFWFAVYCVCCVRFEFVLWLLCSLG